VRHAAVTGMRILHLVLSMIRLDHGGLPVHRVPLMLINWSQSMIAMMFRFSYRRSRMMRVIVMGGFRVIHRVPFDRPVPH
jgi:hypothetical protein